MEVLLGDGDSKWKAWFSVIRKWLLDAVDSERLTKVWVFGVPCSAWNNDSFVALANSLGTFLSLDDSTCNGSTFEFARIVLKVKINFVPQQIVKVEIDEKSFLCYFGRSYASATLCRYI